MFKRTKKIDDQFVGGIWLLQWYKMRGTSNFHMPRLWQLLCNSAAEA